MTPLELLMPVQPWSKGIDAKEERFHWERILMLWIQMNILMWLLLCWGHLLRIVCILRGSRCIELWKSFCNVTSDDFVLSSCHYLISVISSILSLVVLNGLKKKTSQRIQLEFFRCTRRNLCMKNYNLHKPNSDCPAFLFSARPCFQPNIHFVQEVLFVCLLVCLMVFKSAFNNISVILRRSALLVEETTDLSQVTDKLYHIMFYTSPLSRFELTTSVVIGTDCICSCKSKYHTITYLRQCKHVTCIYNYIT